MRPLFRQSEAYDAKSAQGEPSDPWGSPVPVENRTDVTEIAKKLAAHGGGAVSFDLALDLVLNEMVQLARDATGATGAAIALERAGEMVCRATTGGNAPDLGVRVESSSGLTGTCLQTGEIQLCADTEKDARVDAETCRHLGVRSMLIAPILEGGRASGILEVFSSRANSFGAQDIDTVRGLTRKIADNQKGIIEAAQAPESSISEMLNPPVPEPVAMPDLSSVHFPSEAAAPEAAEETTGESRDVWTTVLVFLVILAAVMLGIVIGWRVAAGNRTNTHRPVRATVAAPPQNSSQDQAVNDQPLAPSSEEGKSETAAAPQPKAAASPSAVNNGGLVITQNGKVVFRQSPSPAAHDTARSATPQSSDTRLIRRVEPQYPPAAQVQHIQGTVVLDVQVLANGQVGNVQVVSGDPMLAEAAVQAVKQWRYRPNAVDGRPVEGQNRVTINFKLPAN